MSFLGLLCSLFVKYQKRAKPLPKRERDTAGTDETDPAAGGCPPGRRVSRSAGPEAQKHSNPGRSLIVPAVITLFITTPNGAVQTFVGQICVYQRHSGYRSLLYRFCCFHGAVEADYRKNWPTVLGWEEFWRLPSRPCCFSAYLVFAGRLGMFLLAAVFYGLALGCNSAHIKYDLCHFLCAGTQRKGDCGLLQLGGYRIGVSAILLGRVSQAFGFPQSICALGLLLDHARRLFPVSAQPAAEI
jgi:hypothetical protein